MKLKEIIDSLSEKYKDAHSRQDRAAIIDNRLPRLTDLR